MNEMKRRVAAILEFVSRMQVERPPGVGGRPSSGGASGSGSKGANTPNGMNGSASSSAVSLPTATLVTAIEAAGGLKETGGGGGGEEKEAAVRVTGPNKPNKNFDDMDSGEMMHALTRELVTWQSVYGKYGEK